MNTREPIVSCVRAVSGGVVLKVLAAAGSSVSKVRGLHGGALKVAVRAAPEKGRANDEIVEVLADFFCAGRQQVSVLAGQTSRSKQVQVLGLSAEAAVQRIHSIG